MRTSLSNIISEIRSGQFTNDELNTVAEAIKFARAQLSYDVKRNLVPGVRVKFTSNRNGRVYSGVVEGVKIKNVIVATAMGRYRVPANMLEME
jgi:hypothetical protein